MTPFRKALATLVGHPSAGLASIIVTFGLGLLTFIPAADEYSELQARSEDIAHRTKQAKLDEANLPRARENQAKTEKELQLYRTRGMDEQSSYRLREQLVQICRTHHCQVRRVDVGTARTRDWYENDHLIHPPTAVQRGKKTPLVLESRDLTMTLSGDYEGVRSFLAEFEQIDALMQIDRLHIETLDGEGRNVQLNIGLRLFHVAERREVFKTASIN